jgi:hypothetical protein
MELVPRAGRLLAPGDRDDVAVVNESLAASLPPGSPVVGTTLLVREGGGESAARPVTIVGVVPDSVRFYKRPLRPMPIVYRAASPLPLAFTLAIRADQPMDLARDVSRAIADADPSLSFLRVETAGENLAREAGPSRFFALAVGTLGAVALVVAAGGLFAVMAYVVSLRTREFGVRMALGANAADIARLVFRQVSRLTLIGLAAGVALSAPLASVLRFVFLGLSPADPYAIVAVVTLLAAVAAVAGFVPARRAASVDPVRALRAD